ncbi:MAG: hypothetical protein EOO38_00920 [Cytophagaceae bacterium]|nr:MAG: hypothetical protein EOO38_00920 [Cytophagaceae bacterium]
MSGSKPGESGNAKLTAAQVLKIWAAYAKGDITGRALGQQYGVSKATVYALVHRRNWGTVTSHLPKLVVPRRKRRGNARLTEAQVLKIWAEYVTRGVSAYVVAAKYNVGPGTVHAIARRATWTEVTAHLPDPPAAPPIPTREETRRDVKLTPAKVRGIRKRLAKGASCAELSREIGLSHQAICMIKNRQTWKHV